MKKILYILLVSMISLAMVQCTKEGPRGPQGPAGADGSNGTNGTNGTSGTNGLDGKDGNANVVTYFITDSASIAWQGDNIKFYYTGSLSIPDSIIDFGIILVYKQVLGSSATQKLWYAVPGMGYNAMYTTRLFIRHDYMEIRAYKPDGTYWSTGTLPQLYAIKVILVPPSTVIHLKKSGTVINFDDHDATMEALGL